MMGKMRDENYLLEILKYISKINRYIGSKNYDEFMEDDMCSDACVLMLSEIGEKSGCLSTRFKEENNDINWQEIKDMRNIMIHNYEGINYDIVWDTIKEDIPEIEKKVYEIITEKYNYTDDDLSDLNIKCLDIKNKEQIR